MIDKYIYNICIGINEGPGLMDNECGAISGSCKTDVRTKVYIKEYFYIYI
jgi:hypothetical protein